MKARFLLSIILLVASHALAQTARVPKEKIPQAILDQLRMIQADFVVALQKDCGDKGCYPRGCVYSSHEQVTMQGDQLLPGLISEGRQANPSDPQHILTAVYCEYAFEDSLDKKDVLNLSKRVSTKLSNGVLKVTARGSAMPPALAPPSKLQTTQTRLARIEARLMEHFSWVLGFLLGVAFILIAIWSLRRLGRDSKKAELQHELMKRRLEAEAKAQRNKKPKLVEERQDPAGTLTIRLQKLQSDHQKSPTVLSHQLREWLENEDFEKLATALLLLSPQFDIPLPSGSEYLLKQMHFQRFAQNFRARSEHNEVVLEHMERMMALRSHSDQEAGLRMERFFRYVSPEELAAFIQNQTVEVARSLLAIAPGIEAQKIFAAVPKARQLDIARSFWTSDRISVEAVRAWEQCSQEVFSGQNLLPLELGPGTVSIPIDAGLILSFIFPYLSPPDRAALQALGERPWTRQIFCADFLEDLDEHDARDVLLSCDAPLLAHWFNTLSASEQQLVWKRLPASYQQQIKSASYSQLDADSVIAVIRSCGRALQRKRGAKAA